MKIKKMEMYRPVRFGKEYIDHVDIAMPKFEKAVLTYIPEMNAVSIVVPGVDSAIVFSANIAYIKPIEEVVKKATK